VWVASWGRAFGILSLGLFDFAITHKLSLNEFEKGYEMVQNPVNSVKIILDPTLGLPILQSAFAADDAHNSFILALGTPHADEPFDIRGSVVFVTGSSRGIGRTVAETLSAAGVYVVFHGTRLDPPQRLDEDTLSLKELAAEVELQTKCATFAVWGDLTNPHQVARIYEQIKRKFGRVDALVCCAGGNIGAVGVDTSLEGKPCCDSALHINFSDMKSIMDVNLLTAVLCCQKFCPDMQDRKYGRVIIIGSVAGNLGRSNGPVYAVAKAGLHA
jgi:NAD(P)-dependent dehydrogenase (short-subunit alcohol dehydrogenase family)